MITIVIIAKYLSFNAFGAECGTEMVFDEVRLFMGLHHHARLVRAVQGFVLNRNGMNRNPFGFHRLNVSDEIFCINVITFGSELAANEAPVCLHPRRCGPRRAHDLNIRIEEENSSQNRYNIRIAGIDIERRKFKILFSFRHIIICEREKTQIRCAQSKTQNTVCV